MAISANSYLCRATIADSIATLFTKKCKKVTNDGRELSECTLALKLGRKGTNQMPSRKPRIGGFRIEGDPDNLQLILLSTAQRELIRYRLAPELLYKLAVEIPRYANQLANSGTVNDFASFNEWCR